MTVQAISPTRTLALPEYSGVTLGLQWPLVWPAKDPGDAGLDYSLDVTGWLNEIQDTVASFTVGWLPSSNTGDLSIASAFAHNGICTVLTSAGNSFTTYDVTLAITSTTGKVLERTIALPVEPRYASTIAPSSGVSGVAQ